MKKLLPLVAMLGLAASAFAGSFVAIQGVYVNGTTNTVVQAGTNVVVNWAPNAANYYNMPGAASPDVTNMLPACPILPGNVTYPVRQLGLYCAGSLANAATLKFTLASSVNGSIWVSNQSVVTITGTGAGNIIQTNVTIDTGGIPYWSLQSIVSSSGAASNLCIVPVGKPGI